MKVNERCLIYIAQSDNNPIDHCGWLHKFSDDKKTFQKKWFILKENLLFYYNYKTDKEPLGVIILDGYRVEIIECVENDRFAFKIDFGISRFGLQLKSYILAADSHSEMERWVKALSCASYDYLKMVVSELQHRLDERKMIVSNNSTNTNNKNNDKRFNPFDESKDINPNITFLDLHEKYGRQIRKHFH